MADDVTALEQFRQQWQAEVEARSRRSKKGGPSHPHDELQEDEEAQRRNRLQNRPREAHPLASQKHLEQEDSDEDEGAKLTQQFDNIELDNVDDDGFSTPRSDKEPKSALEHYERAVEIEGQGKHGDSINHYRRAYRMDAQVDKKYKNKYFPLKSKPEDLNPSGAPVTVPNTAHHSSKEPTRYKNTAEMVLSYAAESIQGIPPIIAGDRVPPCPIKDLPYEVLSQVMTTTAVLDPASFTRLAAVCKKLAYYVFTENAIWRRVALGQEFGACKSEVQF